MEFINEDFLLKNDTAKRLYHSYAENMPIIDYHCHINPKEIAEDRKFGSITEVWLGGDHYKWRLIRCNGVDENEVTGDCDDFIKFKRFAEMLPKSIGNPMYHWTHLELKRYFGYNGILNADTAAEVYALCNEKLKDDSMSAKGIIRRSNVRLIGTTDDPADSLEWHAEIKKQGDLDTAVVPSFRPDRAVNIEKDGFAEYIRTLSKSAGIEITDFSALTAALTKRLDFFCSLRCRASDHGIGYIPFAPASISEIDEIFGARMSGKEIDKLQIEKYKTAVLLALGREYAKRGVVMQLHYGVQRNTNKKMFQMLGADTGYDCVCASECSEKITAFLSELEYENSLPKTIIYSLNPCDNEMIDSIIGCFHEGGICGKVQHGAAWWFNDTKEGMERHIKSLASISLLGSFVGMLTDSRSFLSYTRHEYFRRILCGIIGEWVENGEYPNDEKALSELIADISYNNAEKFFNV